MSILGLFPRSQCGQLERDLLDVMSTSWDLWYHYSLSVNAGECQPIVVVPDSWKVVLQLQVHIFCVEL